MNEVELQKWRKAARERDAGIHRADVERVERELEAARAKERELAEQRLGEEAFKEKLGRLNNAVWELQRCANDLRASNVHLYAVARYCAIAMTYSRHMSDPANMGNDIFAFTTWLAEWTNHCA